MTNVYYCYIQFRSGESTKYTNITEYSVINNILTLKFFNMDTMLVNFDEIFKVRFMIQGQKDD